MRNIFLFILLFFVLSLNQGFGDIIFVTTSSDSGAGTFRQVLFEADSSLKALFSRLTSSTRRLLRKSKRTMWNL